MMDQYCIRISRKNILKPKNDGVATEYRQMKIETYCQVLGERENVLRPKGDKVVKMRRQMRLEM